MCTVFLINLTVEVSRLSFFFLTYFDVCVSHHPLDFMCLRRDHTNDEMKRVRENQTKKDKKKNTNKMKRQINANFHGPRNDISGLLNNNFFSLFLNLELYFLTIFGGLQTRIPCMARVHDQVLLFKLYHLMQSNKIVLSEWVCVLANTQNIYYLIVCIV